MSKKRINVQINELALVQAIAKVTTADSVGKLSITIDATRNIVVSSFGSDVVINSFDEFINVFLGTATGGVEEASKFIEGSQTITDELNPVPQSITPHH